MNFSGQILGSHSHFVEKLFAFRKLLPQQFCFPWKVAKAYVKAGEGRFIELVDGPDSRVRFAFPLVKEFLQAFGEDMTFDEDEVLLNDAMKSFFIDYKTIQGVPIFRSIKLIDLMKFRRFFLFVQFALEEFCKSRNLLNSMTYYRSLVMHFSQEKFKELLTSICGIPDASQFLELICSFDPTKEVFDLQYNPVLYVAGQYLVPAAVAGNSNTLRNSMFTTQFRFDSDGSVDALGDYMVRIFDEAGTKAVRRIAYNWRGTKGEADVLARVDDVLFAFECKNSLLPCNVFELRQTYDYIKKGFEQLDRLRTAFSDAQFREHIGDKSNISLAGVKRLVTCVVTGNRMFDGYRENNHAVL